MLFQKPETFYDLLFRSGFSNSVWRTRLTLLIHGGETRKHIVTNENNFYPLVNWPYLLHTNLSVCLIYSDSN